MTREEYIRFLIKQNGYTAKQFADKIEMPYTSLLTILNRSFGGASIDSIMKICKNLNITVEDLENQSVVDVSKRNNLLSNFYKLDDLGQNKVIEKIELLVDEQSKRNNFISNNEFLTEDDKRALDMYTKLDIQDKAEIRGELKQMLKADKYKKMEKLNLNA